MRPTKPDALLLTACAEYIRADNEYENAETTEDGSEYEYPGVAKFWNKIRENAATLIHQTESESITGLQAKVEVIMLECLREEPTTFEWPNGKLREIAKQAAALISE